MSHYDCPCMEHCPLHYAMNIIGGKWKVQILCAVTNAGSIRYNALSAKLDGVSNTVLSGTRFSDYFFLAHVFCKKHLSHTVVKLMSACVIQVLTL